MHSANKILAIVAYYEKYNNITSYLSDVTQGGELQFLCVNLLQYTQASFKSGCSIHIVVSGGAMARERLF